MHVYIYIYIYVLHDFWLIPHPVVIWLTYGSMECNMYVCNVCMYVAGLMHQLQLLQQITSTLEAGGKVKISDKNWQVNLI
jgi:hypothetical protein